jgi:hypothetical protein
LRFQFERSAVKLKELGRWQDALEVYMFMADGDPSLDAGYLGTSIAECYEAMGRSRKTLASGYPAKRRCAGLAICRSGIC